MSGPARQAVGLVTIGQSPRTDLVPEMISWFPARIRARVQVIERGALDGLGTAGLSRLAPGPAEAVLVTRLRDGTEVALAEDRVLPLLQAAVDHVLDLGAAIVAVLCTGVDGALRCPRPLLTPGPLVRGLVAATAPGGRLGVLVPAAEQVASARADWLAAVSGPVEVLAASPYGPAAAAAVERAAVALASWRPDLVVLDCLGFDERLQQLAARATAVPVLLPRAVLAGAIAALA